MTKFFDPDALSLSLAATILVASAGLFFVHAQAAPSGVSVGNRGLYVSAAVAETSLRQLAVDRGAAYLHIASR